MGGSFETTGSGCVSNHSARATTVGSIPALIHHSAPRRIRDREHVKSVAKQPCLVCGRRPADAHHLRFVQSRALSRKVGDEFTIDKSVLALPADPTAAARAL
jgi:hypothetical protein